MERRCCSTSRRRVPRATGFLIIITVLGSAGPIRFVFNEEMLVAAVIDTALKSYAPKGRLPILGSDLNEFMLYCPTAGPYALSPCPWDTIGSQGTRSLQRRERERVEVSG